MTSYTLEHLAAQVSGQVQGDSRCAIEGIASLDTAGPGDISFLSNSKYRHLLPSTRASAVILAPADAPQCPVSSIVTDDPYLAYARIAGILRPADGIEPGIDPAASVSPEAVVDAGASVGAMAVVEAGASIAAGVRIGPGCIIGAGASIGENSCLDANVTVLGRAVIGRRAVIHPGVVIGGDGFGIAKDGEQWVKVPQLGSVRIGDDVEIGANTTIDRGAIGDTVIGDGVKLDNLIQVGHNVHIGANTAIAACAGISGSTHIGKRCIIGGAAGFAGHLEIVDDVIITGRTMVTKSISKPGIYSSGMPVRENAKWRKDIAHFNRLEEMFRRLKALEQSRED